MRTTVTLDEDVATKLTLEARQTGRSFKEVLNDMVRLAFTLRPRRATRQRFVVKPQPLGLPAELSYDNIGTLLEQLEGPTHK